MPEAESEIIAGYLIEYSGFKYALFFLGEYLGLFAVSGLGDHACSSAAGTRRSPFLGVDSFLALVLPEARSR